MLNDQKIIEKLENFTDALEAIVELMKETTKKGDADVLDKVASKMDGEKIEQIIAELKSIKTDTVSIESKIDKISEAVKASKKEKEAGMFEKVEDGKNKEKIVNGIKAVILIAAGVLAMGVAFKLLGHIDVVSVIGFAVGLYILSKTFAAIAEIKSFDWMTMTLVTMTLVIISAALWASAKILSNLPTMKKEQLATVIFLGFGLSLAAIMLSYAADKIKLSTVPFFLLMPIILPLIAYGIAESVSYLAKMDKFSDPYGQGITLIIIAVAMAIALIGLSYVIGPLKNTKVTDFVFIALIMPIVAAGILAASDILNNVVPMTWQQALSMLVVTIVLTIAMMGIAMILFVMKGFTINIPFLPSSPTPGIGLVDILFVVSIIPLVAYGIVLASKIFKDMTLLDNGWAMIGTSLAMAIAITAFMPAIWVASKIPFTSLIKGIMAIPLIAYAILLTDGILSQGDFSKYPGVDWTLGSAISVFAFGLMAAGFGILMSSGVGFGLIALGALSIVIVAGAILATDVILALGTYKKYPSFDWIGGIMITVGSFMIIGLMALVAAAFALPILTITGVILAVDKILSMSDFKRYPSTEWIDGIKKTISEFVVIGVLALVASLFSAPILLISGVILGVDKILSSGNFEKYPSIEWIDGIKKTIGGFVTIGVLALAASFFIIPLLLTSTSIVSVDKILSKGTFEKYPSLEWVKGVSDALKLFASTGSEIGFFSAAGKFLFGDPMVLTADAIVRTSLILSKGNYSNSPSTNWVNDISTTFLRLANISNSLSDLDLDPLLEVSKNIASASVLIAGGNYANTGASKWMSDMSNSLLLFISVIDRAGKVDSGDLDDILDVMTNLNEIGYQTDGIMNLSMAIKELSGSLNMMDTSGVEKLMKLSGSFLTLSFIDSVKLNDAINKIKEKAGVISSVIDNSFQKKGIPMDNKFTMLSSKEKSKEDTTKTTVDETSEASLNVLKNIDKNIAKMADSGVASAHKIDNKSGVSFLGIRVSTD